MSYRNLRAALLFENVKGSSLPVLINAFGNARRMAMALNVATLDELSSNLVAVIDLKLPKGLGAALNRAGDMLGVLAAIGLKPKIVRRAPCKDGTRIRLRVKRVNAGAWLGGQHGDAGQDERNRLRAAIAL